MSDGPVPILPPKEAIDFFRAKGLARSFAWQDIEKAAHDFVFTVAKMLRVSLLEEVADLIGTALEDGRSPQALRGQLKQLLRERGWWGRRSMVDPLTGEQNVVQLGSNRRVRTIVNTNLRTAYAAGRWARQDRVKQQLPILVYKSRMDGRERPQHHDWHNTALPIGDPWWQTHYPPCDWGCRCRTVSMTRGQAERRGLPIGEKPPYFGTRKWLNKRTGEVQEVEKGIGAGWDYHPGRAALDGLAPEPLFPFSKVDPDGEATADAPSAWLSAFGLSEPSVWRDATGWPLPIGPAWLDGMPARMQADAAQAARAIAAPESIRLLWIVGKDKRRMLVRRYAGGGWVVDVGSSFWRFRRGGAGAGGIEIWAEGQAVAAYDPSQPRHPKGSPDGGRFRRTGKSAARASLSGDLAPFRKAVIGTVGPRAAELARAAGYEIGGRGFVVEHAYGAKTIERHGPVRMVNGRRIGETRKSQIPISVGELLGAHDILEQAFVIRPARTNPATRFEAISRSNKGEHHLIGEIAGNRNVRLVSLWHVRGE